MYITKIILSLIMSLNIFVSPFEWLSDTADKLYSLFSKETVVTVTPQSEILLEANTMHVISQSDSDEITAAGHFAKLMTLLIAAEQIEAGEISLSGLTVTSKYANSMQGTQIWLDVGEAITIEELIKAITIGNANDACVALAEAVYKSEEAFVEKMNVRAKELDMHSTYFADCTGVSDATVTSARDIAILTAELSRHDWLFEYTTTWLDNVRECNTELVNNNILVRSYNGIIGFKAFTDDRGHHLSCAAKRGDMTVVYVSFGVKEKDELFSTAKESMNKAFAAYEIFTPQFDDKVLADCNVNCGEKLICSVKASDECVLLIPKGRKDDIEIGYERVELIPAPVKKGTVIGKISVLLDDKILFSADIITAENVKKLTVLEMYRRLLLELLNI